LLAGCRKIVFGQGQIRGESFINGTVISIFMADMEAINLVREALKSGKSENGIVALMRQAGYTDPAVSEILTEAKKGAYPADELARRIAEKNNIPVQQNLPKLGPSNLPSQPPRVQPMPISSSGLDKSIIGMFKLSIDSFLHPAGTSKRIKGNVSMGDSAKLLAILGIAIALIFSIIMLIGVLLLGSIASAATASVNFGAFFISWIVMAVTMLIVMPLALLLGWVIGTGILWVSAKILGGTRSYSEFAAEMAFAQVGISLANVVVIIIESIIMAVIAVNAVAAMVSAFTTGGSLGILGILGTLATFAGTMIMGWIITGLIGLVFGIYALYVFVIFIRESMELSTLRAVLAIFLPLIVIFFLGTIASVMVWYWISPLTSAPGGFTTTYPGGTGGTTQYSLMVTSAWHDPSGGCDSMDIKNSGGTTIPSDVIFGIKDSATGAATGNYVVIRSELGSGETGNFDITSSPFDSSAVASVPSGSYFLSLSSLTGSNAVAANTYFTC